MKFISRLLGTTKGVCDQVPWQIVALVAAWMLRSGLQSGFDSVGVRSVEGIEESYELEVLRDPSVSKGLFFGSFGEQVVGRHLHGVTIVKKTRQSIGARHRSHDPCVDRRPGKS